VLLRNRGETHDADFLFVNVEPKNKRLHDGTCHPVPVSIPAIRHANKENRFGFALFLGHSQLLSC
jgi:hypothetical protein